MMSKKSKNLGINILLVLLTYVLPLYVFQKYQDDYAHIDIIQKVVFAILLCGSILLTYLNNKNRIQIQTSKWLWIVFEILSIFGIIYSLIVLWLILSFSHGIGL